MEPPNARQSPKKLHVFTTIIHKKAREKMSVSEDEEQSSNNTNDGAIEEKETPSSSLSDFLTNCSFATLKPLDKPEKVLTFSDFVITTATYTDPRVHCCVGKCSIAGTK